MMRVFLFVFLIAFVSCKKSQPAAKVKGIHVEKSNPTSKLAHAERFINDLKNGISDRKKLNYFIAKLRETKSELTLCIYDVDRESAAIKDAVLKLLKTTNVEIVVLLKPIIVETDEGTFLKHDALEYRAYAGELQATPLGFVKRGLFTGGKVKKINLTQPYPINDDFPSSQRELIVPGRLFRQYKYKQEINQEEARMLLESFFTLPRKMLPFNALQLAEVLTHNGISIYTENGRTVLRWRMNGGSGELSLLGLTLEEEPIIEVVHIWYAGMAKRHSYTYELIRTEGKWEIERLK